jgi:hypothetical protein
MPSPFKILLDLYPIYFSLKFNFKDCHFLSSGGIYDATLSFRSVYYFNAVTYAMTAGLYVVIIIIARRRPVFLFPPMEFQQTTNTSHVSYGTELNEPSDANNDEFIVYDKEHLTQDE